MENLIQILQNWYPLLFLLSTCIALIVWVLASRKKARVDIQQAAELMRYRINRNGRRSQNERENRQPFSSKDKHIK